MQSRNVPVGIIPGREADVDPAKKWRRDSPGGSHLSGCVRFPPLRPGSEAGLGSGPHQGSSRQREAAAARDSPGEARRGGAVRDGKGRPRGPGCSSRRAPIAAMGLETEKADVQLFMDDDAYSRHSGVDYADLDKFADSGSDRDPHRLNSHLKVKKPGAGRNLGPATAWGQGAPFTPARTPTPSLATGSAQPGPGPGIHMPWGRLCN